MHKHIKIYELKQICKKLAEEIRSYNADYKIITKKWRFTQYNEPGYKEDWAEFHKKHPIHYQQLRKEYRRHHIAHCLLRGKKYEQIEPKVREENQLKKHDWDEIGKIREKYYEVITFEEATV